MTNLPDPSQLLREVRTVREEPVEIDGKKYDCWVVETKIERFAMPQAQGIELTGCLLDLWLSKDLKLSLQMTMSGKIQGGPLPAPVETKQKMTMRSLRFDLDLPDSLFHFSPPEGAKEVAEFSAPGLSKPDLTGKPAPVFRVQSLDGKTQDLAELKGKVVLLDFWVTWCSPCRKEMPALDKLYQEYRDQGLILLGLNVGEDRQTVEKFLKTANLSYPFALTNETNVVPAYQVSAFPTHVLIDRDGTVVGFEVGSVGLDALRSLLEKAGLKPAAPRD